MRLDDRPLYTAACESTGIDVYAPKPATSNARAHRCGRPVTSWRKSGG